MSLRALKQAGALCDRWAGQEPGTPVPCRSTLVGRKLELKQPGREREVVELVACAVPRPTSKPSKKCKTAFLGRGKGGKGVLQLVDGGKARNASRTPRPTHAGLDVEWVAGEMIDGPIQRMKTNQLAGRDELAGLDVPFPHRAGSSICCPTSALSAYALSLEVLVAEQDEGAMTASLVSRLGRLAEHLRTRHQVGGLSTPRDLEDFGRANAITAAATGYCTTYLYDWQRHAVEDAAVRRVERKKAARRKASQRKRDSVRAKTGNSRAVKALLRQSRRASGLY